MIQNWTYSICENCKRNAHKEHKMIKRNVISLDNSGKAEEFWICSKCGYTRKL